MARAGGFDGTVFHRIVPRGIVQGGDPLSKDPKKKALYGTGGLGLLKAEFSAQPMTRGAVAAVLRPSSPDSAGNQFFICLSDQPALTGKFTIFGEVASGMEAVDAIGASAVVGRPADGAHRDPQGDRSWTRAASRGAGPMNASFADRRTVLVADDEEDVRFLLSRLLGDVGYEVYLAQDGLEALDRIDASKPDLMILDLMMPGLDGWGVLKRLEGHPNPPLVVLLTARGDPESFARGMRAGAAAYVTKPFRFHELIATVQGLLASDGKAPVMHSERRREPRRPVTADVQSSAATTCRSPSASAWT